MKNIIWAIAILFITTSCKETSESVEKETQAVKTVTISGNIQFTDSLTLEEVVVYGYDMFNKKTIQEGAKVDENGDFSTTIELSQPTSLTLYSNNVFVIMAAPGDDIAINYTESKDEDAFKESLKFSGSTALTQEQFQDYKANYPLQTDAFYEEESTLDFNDLETLINKNKESLTSYYDKFLKDDKINQHLKDYIAADQKYGMINSKMEYISYAKYYGKKLPEMDSPYYESMNNIPQLSKSDMVNTDAVNGILRNSYTTQYQAVKKNMPDATENEIDQKVLESLMANKTNMNQEMVSMILMADLNDHSISLYENNSDEVMDYLKESSLLTTIQKKHLKTKKLIEKPDIPKEAELLTFTSDDATAFIDEIVANANGKVVYIDNWATWCGPCKAEFKEASPALHEKFKDDVEFVYLCHASEERAYLPSIAEYKIKGKHYFLTDEQGEIVQNQINLEGFPTYTIFDKKGNQVLSDYIHRPSHQPTAEILTQLVEGKEVDMANFTSSK